MALILQHKKSEQIKTKTLCYKPKKKALIQLNTIQLLKCEKCSPKMNLITIKKEELSHKTLHVSFPPERVSPRLFSIIN